ncbi:hypothetical protein AB0H07_46725 [Streptomyces sp. NPDC021354]
MGLTSAAEELAGVVGERYCLHEVPPPVRVFLFRPLRGCLL